MTRTGYPWQMFNKPSDRNYINRWALEGLMRSVDRALTRRHDLENAEPDHGDEDLKKLMVEERDRKERFEREVQSDDIRLRKYNDEWIKNNIR